MLEGVNQLYENYPLICFKKVSYANCLVFFLNLSSNANINPFGSFHGRSPNGCQVKNFKFFQISAMDLIH